VIKQSDPASPLLVALDVDGTILDHDERLSDRVRGAVRAVADGGHHVVVATGRSLHGTLPVLDRLGLTTGYAVCSNGAVTLGLDPSLADGYELVDVVTFDPAPALRLLREHLPAAAFAVEDVGSGFRLAGPFPQGELTGQLTVVPFEELLDVPATRVVVRSPEHTPQDFLELTSRIGLHGVNYAVGWTAWLDIAPDGVSKASALERVRERLGVGSVSTVAAGDGRNDLEMLGWAARSIAMGNAPDEVRAAAGEVAGDVADDGLAEVLEGLVAHTERRLAR
jgi:hydroxymethylpyrimidine pyrophosphatase-like HAD family hydrolase